MNDKTKRRYEVRIHGEVVFTTRHHEAGARRQASLIAKRQGLTVSLVEIASGLSQLVGC
jgi:hypothetical protein